MSSNWCTDLTRAIDSDLMALLTGQPDDAALGIGLLTWLARSREGGLLTAVNVQSKALVSLVDITDGTPCEVHFGAFSYQGADKGPWSLLLCPSDYSDDFPSLEDVLQGPACDETIHWLEPNPDGNLSAHSFLSRNPGLLDIGHESLGSALRLAMAIIARQRGLLDAITFGVTMAGMLEQTVRMNGSSVSVTVRGARARGRELGDWTVRCASVNSHELTRSDIVLQADTSTPEAARKLLRMMDNADTLTQISIHIEDDICTGMSVKGRPA